ncbi:MAG: hypothetical protein WA254_13900 [Candidatus Sulfotelmatobacter sp.]
MRRLSLVVLGLSLSIVPGAGAQRDATSSGGSNPKTIEYKSGQVWKTGFGPIVTILKIEELPKVGRVVHVRVDNVPVQNCGGFQLTRTIEHMALAEKVMTKGVTKLIKDNVDLPDSYFEAYRKWEKQKKREVVKVPIQEAVLRSSAPLGPIICNFLPSQT